MIEIVLATLADLAAIDAIIRKVTAMMLELDIQQWNDQ